MGLSDLCEDFKVPIQGRTGEEWNLYRQTPLLALIRIRTKDLGADLLSLHREISGSLH